MVKAYHNTEKVKKFVGNEFWEINRYLESASKQKESKNENEEPNIIYFYGHPGKFEVNQGSGSRLRLPLSSTI